MHYRMTVHFSAEARLEAKEGQLFWLFRFRYVARGLPRPPIVIS